MDKGLVHIIFGEGRGKTTSAIGQAIRAASEGKSVIIIQFLKEKQRDDIGFIRRLEPEIKVFRFEKDRKSFDSLSEEERQEEIQNLRNALNFARKVLVTEECDVLILDEVLGLVEHGIANASETMGCWKQKHDDTELILTGIYEGREFWDLADVVTEMVTKKNH